MKKLIIQIPEVVHNRAINGELTDLDAMFICGAVAGAKPLQAELEELEAKIKPFTKDRINPHCYDVGFINGALEGLWVVQERIEELNNEETNN